MMLKRCGPIALTLFTSACAAGSLGERSRPQQGQPPNPRAVLTVTVGRADVESLDVHLNSVATKPVQVCVATLDVAVLLDGVWDGQCGGTTDTCGDGSPQWSRLEPGDAVLLHAAIPAPAKGMARPTPIKVIINVRPRGHALERERLEFVGDLLPLTSREVFTHPEPVWGIGRRVRWP